MTPVYCSTIPLSASEPWALADAELGMQDDWQDLQEKLANGTPVYAPRTSLGSPSKKRKRQSRPSGSRKNRQAADSDGESDVADQDDSDDESDKENSQPSQTDREPLTEEQIEETLASIKEQKKKMRLKRREYDTQIRELKQQMREVENEKKGLGGQRKSICIKGRNEYSRGAIKNDFSAGIKEYARPWFCNVVRQAC